MMTNKTPLSSERKVDLLSLSLGLGVLCISFTMALHNGLKYKIRNALSLNERVVLSTISGSITPEGLPLKVVKVKADNQIFVEIYNNENNEQRLISKLAIPDSQDGYFHIKGDSSNLILNDIDGDNVAEIIVPSFDRDFVAHLNIFKFDSLSNSFYLMSSNEGK